MFGLSVKPVAGPGRKGLRVCVCGKVLLSLRAIKARRPAESPRAALRFHNKPPQSVLDHRISTIRHQFQPTTSTSSRPAPPPLQPPSSISRCTVQTPPPLRTGAAREGRSCAGLTGGGSAAAACLFWALMRSSLAGEGTSETLLQLRRRLGRLFQTQIHRRGRGDQGRGEK